MKTILYGADRFILNKYFSERKSKLLDKILFNNNILTKRNKILCVKNEPNNIISLTITDNESIIYNNNYDIFIDISTYRYLGLF